MLSRLTPWLSFFASTSTLVCCALPSLFVVLGMGASLAGLIGVFPQIVWISQYKVYVFIISGGLISLASALHYFNRNAPCPIDPILANRCQNARAWSLRILVISFGLWAIGAFFAFVAPQLF